MAISLALCPSASKVTQAFFFIPLECHFLGAQNRKKQEKNRKKQEKNGKKRKKTEKNGKKRKKTE
ncbi:MAG: hypothetical protein ACPGWR_00925, partial [Ardenticatenaceae bacterium]